MKMAVPAMISGYDLHEVVYEGSTTILYRARSHVDQQSVILKVLQVEHPTLEQIDRLRQEYEITANLDLPHVIKVYRLETQGRHTLLVLEDIAGLSLKQWLASATVKPTENPAALANAVAPSPLALPHCPTLVVSPAIFLSIAIPITKALISLHQHQIIHRDIKPSNIIINPHTGVVKLTDFSIALRFSPTSPPSDSPHQLAGTLAYISPEQTGRMDRPLDYRSDFYSLGVTFYELLTGQLPFLHSDPLALVAAHLSQKPLPMQDLNPTLPLPIVRMVNKLMAKNADDRYQSAAGLLVDLEQCCRVDPNTGMIPEFRVGARDRAGQFRLPATLYGRTMPLATLLAAVERANQGSSELVVITGALGLGKTALMQALAQRLRPRPGYVITGKCAPWQRDRPFAAIAAAVGGLVQQILSESESSIAHWRQCWQTALGLNGQVVVEVIPELELIIGPQPALPPLGVLATQQRFFQTFKRFFQAMASAEAPLVICLDDMQWADESLLQVLPRFITLPGMGYRLVVLAYRDPAAADQHLWMATLQKLRAQGQVFDLMPMSPLTLADVTQLVAETLSSPPTRVSSLAQWLYHKTQGNPGGVRQLSQSLYSAGLLRFNYPEGRWEWDIAQLQPHAIESPAIEVNQADCPTMTSTSTTTSASEILDLATVLKAAQAISSEIVLERLLENLLHIILENAAAQKGCIILERNQALYIEVADTHQQAMEVVVQSVLVQESGEIPLSLIQYVARTQASIVFANATTEALIAADPYVLRCQPKSILCAPILYQGKFLGLVYLENNLITGAFTRDRLELMQLLTAQAAIAIENANLYAREQEKAQQLQSSLEQLRASEAQFRQLFDSSADAILLLDGETFIDCNAAAIQMMRCQSKAQLLSLHPSKLSPQQQPDGRESFDKANEMIATAFQQGSHRFEWVHRRNNGEDFWVEVVLTAMLYQDKVLLHTIWREIGDRKAAEAALQQSEARNRAILSTLPDMMFGYNAAGIYVDFFPSIDWHPLISPDIFLHKSIFAVLPATIATQVFAAIGQALATHELQILEYQLTLDNGVCHDYESRFIAYDSDKVLQIVRDISERKRAEQAIQQKSQELEQALIEVQQAQMQMVQGEKMSALGNLVAGVAHEINNPIGFLTGSIKNAQDYAQDLLAHLTLYQKHYAQPVEVIQDHAEAIDLEYLHTDLPKLLHSMQGATDRITGISTSLRTFSRADTAYKVTANLHDGVDSTILILKYRLKATPFRPEIVIKREYSELPLVRCFPGQLNQVFMNILANAIDAMDEAIQQKTLSSQQATHPEIVVQTTMNGNVIVIKIKDNGPGMPEVVQKKIFEHLFTTKAVGKGTGLGLSIARQIVEVNHGGTLSVNSMIGSGTEFLMQLPVLN